MQIPMILLTRLKGQFRISSEIYNISNSLQFFLEYSRKKHMTQNDIFN